MKICIWPARQETITILQVLFNDAIIKATENALGTTLSSQMFKWSWSHQLLFGCAVSCLVLLWWARSQGCCWPVRAKLITPRSRSLSAFSRDGLWSVRHPWPLHACGLDTEPKRTVSDSDWFCYRWGRGLWVAAEYGDRLVAQSVSASSTDNHRLISHYNRRFLIWPTAFQT